MYKRQIHIYPLSSKSKKGYISIYFYEYEEEIILKESTLNQLASLIKIQSVILQLPGIDALISQLITFYGEQVIKNRIIINTSGGNAFIVGQQVRIGGYDAAAAVMRTITAINNYEDNNITGKEIIFDGEPIASITLSTYIWTSVQNAGGCDALGMKSGCLVNDSKHNVIYRGIEGILGNIFQFVDGINIKDCEAYICYDPTQYVSDKFEAPYEKLGYVNSKQEGYGKTLGFDINHPLIQLPSEIGGSTTTGTSDYYWCSATGNRVARVGGYSINGAHDGLWFWYLSSSSSYATWTCGARVLKYQ